MCQLVHSPITSPYVISLNYIGGYKKINQFFNPTKMQRNAHINICIYNYSVTRSPTETVFF